MTPLDKLLQLAAFDELKCPAEASDYAKGFWAGEADVQANLRPILQALVEVIKVQGEAIDNSIARSDDYGDSHCSQLIREAQAAAAAILEGAMKGGNNG